MIRFCDKDVCCISYEEINRETLLSYFFQGNMDEVVCIINSDGTYRGSVSYYSLINCNKVKDAILEHYITLNKEFWKHARSFFVFYEQTFREHILLPVLDEQKHLISFAYEDWDANRELRMLNELKELPRALKFADVYPQFDCVKIFGFNELAFYFAEYLRDQNICVETDGELWGDFSGVCGGGGIWKFRIINVLKSMQKVYMVGKQKIGWRTY